MGNKLHETIYMTAASILYSCNWFTDVELYVDAIGYEYLYGLPCTVTKVDFDVDQELWMKPKIYAVARQDVPFVHLDTDVFIKKKIDFDFEGVLVERKDLNYYNYKELISFFDQFNDQIPFWNPTLDYAYKKYEVFRNDQDQQGWYVEPGLLLEQYNLTSLLFEKDIKPTVLIPENSTDEQSDYANDIGYTHLLGASKYHVHNTDKIKNILKQRFPKFYKEIHKQVEKSLTKQGYKVV